MKKLLALILTLMMMCALLPAQAEQLAGGWTVAADCTVTEEAADALKSATANLLGSTYEPVALLGTQVVAGVNYCLLCRLTPMVPNAESHYAIVYLWQKLDGTAELLDVSDIDISVPATEDDCTSDFACAIDEEGTIYDLFEITKFLMDETHHVYGVEGNFSTIATNEEDGCEYAKQMPGTFSYLFADNFTARMLNNDLDLVDVDDLYTWYVDTYLNGEAPAEGKELDFWFVTVRIELNAENKITYMEGVYVPWA